MPKKKIMTVFRGT